jgi:hypothetical protein
MPMHKSFLKLNYTISYFLDFLDFFLQKNENAEL